jgi:hypothetical protein
VAGDPPLDDRYGRAARALSCALRRSRVIEPPHQMTNGSDHRSTLARIISSIVRPVQWVQVPHPSHGRPRYAAVAIAAMAQTSGSMTNRTPIIVRTSPRPARLRETHCAT